MWQPWPCFHSSFSPGQAYLFLGNGGQFLPAPTDGVVRHATMLVSIGSRWYRIGETFDLFHADSIAVVFSPADLLSPGDDQDVERVLVFGQLIAGLFHNDKISYVLATVRKSSVTIRLKHTSESGHHSRHWESLLDIDGLTGKRMVWYRLVICTCCVEIGEIALISSPKIHVHTNTDRTVLLEAAHVEHRSASLCGSTRQGVSAGIMIDSGLYVAGVVDGRTTFGTEKIKPFKGQIAVSVCNSSILSQTVSTLTTQGINVESYKSYLNTTVSPVLSLPLSNVEVKRTTTAPRPYVFRFPIVTAASDNHAEEVEAMIATAHKIMPERGIIYTYKRAVCVCWFVGLLVCFLSATRHLSTLRRCLRVAARAAKPSRAAPRERASAHAQRSSESTRAHAVQHTVVYVTAEIFKKSPSGRESRSRRRGRPRASGQACTAI